MRVAASALPISLATSSPSVVRAFLLSMPSADRTCGPGARARRSDLEAGPGLNTGTSFHRASTCISDACSDHNVVSSCRPSTRWASSRRARRSRSSRRHARQEPSSPLCVLARTEQLVEPHRGCQQRRVSRACSLVGARHERRGARRSPRVARSLPAGREQCCSEGALAFDDRRVTGELRADDRWILIVAISASTSACETPPSPTAASGQITPL